MNRRTGSESIFGIGGGMVSKNGQKLVDKAEDLCRRGQPTKAAPYLEAAFRENPENLDAAIQLAFLCDKERCLIVLENAERVGREGLKRCLGMDCFDSSGSCVGHFWAILETRPYMRVMQALVRMYFENGKIDRSADTAIEMLRLCPGDNMSQRTWLASLLLHQNRNSNALFFSQVWMEGLFTSGSPPRGGPGGTNFGAPSRNLFTPKEVKSLCEFGEGTFLHTAALACFRLYGDCEQARQFLKIAVTAQPHILLKILARVRKPENLNMDPRQHNGPEDAQDYLWLAQELWMEPRVWEWANNNEDVKNALLQTCNKEGCSNRETSVAEYKRCAACHKVRYCSKECQTDDWPAHKAACKAHKQYKAAVRAFAMGKQPKNFGMPMASADFSH